MMDDLLQEMIDPAPAPKDAARRRRLWMTVAIVGLAAVGATKLTTAALFTDSATTGSAITSGTVDIEAAMTAFAVPTSGLQPGDSIVAPVHVTNSGSLEHWYYATYTATDDDTVTGTGTGTGGNVHLSDRLTLEVFDDQDACTVPADTDGLDPITTHTGLSRAEAAFFGDPAGQGLPGNRTLGAASAEDLCVKLTFNDGGDDNIYQGTGTSIVLKFYATQAARG